MLSTLANTIIHCSLYHEFCSTFSKLLGFYSLGETLRKTMYGYVQLATNRETGEIVTINVVEKIKVKNKKHLALIMSKINKQKMVEHPNLIKLFETVQTKYSIFVIMEYFKGEELLKFLSQSRKFDEHGAQWIFHQLCSVIKYMSKIKMIGMNIKSENILIDNALKITILNFNPIVMGTKYERLHWYYKNPNYNMSCVQGKVHEFEDEISDSRSALMILYNILWGKLSLGDTNIHDLYSNILAFYSNNSNINSKPKIKLKKRKSNSWLLSESSSTERTVDSEDKTHSTHNVGKEKKKNEQVIKDPNFSNVRTNSQLKAHPFSNAPPRMRDSTDMLASLCTASPVNIRTHQKQFKQTLFKGRKSELKTKFLMKSYENMNESESLNCQIELPKILRRSTKWADRNRSIEAGSRAIYYLGRPKIFSPNAKNVRHSSMANKISLDTRKRIKYEKLVSRKKISKDDGEWKARVRPGVNPNTISLIRMFLKGKFASS